MFEVRRRARFIIKFIASIFFISCLTLNIEAKSKRKPSCFRGNFDRLAGVCSCFDGWYGNKCQYGRQRLTALDGIISDIPNKHGLSSKCLWLIQAKTANSTIQLKVDQFWSNSHWYSLYIYNGSSFRAPLLAAFGGIAKENCTAQRVTGWIRTSSSSVLVYFFRDSNNINSGFKLKYSINNCSSSCGNHGFCYNGRKCLCDSGWSGHHCSTKACPYTCVHGSCNISTWQCDCHIGYSGQSCNISSQYGTWTSHVTLNQDIAHSQTAAGAGIIGNWLWIYGGFILADRPLNKIIRYSFSRNLWQLVSVSNSSINRPNLKYGLSLVVYNKSLIIFGGITDQDTTTNSLWSFDTSTRIWTRLRGSGTPNAVAGHTATIVNNKMIVIFGYGPLGFSNKVQVYDLVTSKWETRISSQHGAYGHTSGYDPVSQLIYVHGGRTKMGYSDALYSYDVQSNHWTLISTSKSPRFLHSSVLLGNMILFFGGNIFTDCKDSKCPDTVFVVYDIICNKWRPIPQGLQPQTAGFGHSAVVYNSKLWVFGGFNGVMKNNIMSYSLGDCSLRKDRLSCTSTYITSGCLWDPSMKACVNPEDGYPRQNTLDKPSCQEECSRISSCGSCNIAGKDCKWCDNTCKKSSESCKDVPVKELKKSINLPCKGSDCPPQMSPCQPYQNCNQNCDQCFNGNKKGNAVLHMWCETQRRCIRTDSYTSVFPNGQCNDWITADCKAVKCSIHKSCDSCLTIPGCGWCDDNEGTGRGFCIEGGGDGHYISNYIMSTRKQCHKWYYTQCPVCQCNGHSICEKGSSCLNCKHHTTGRQCEECASGYYGDPRNGGTCQECQCNGHAKHCHHKTSRCECLVEGVIGHRCEKCDKERKYEGNATNGKLCYYPLQAGGRRTFNVSGKTSLNIKFAPLMKDQDIHFEIKIVTGPKVLMNMSYVQESFRLKEKTIFTRKEFSKFTTKFSHRDYKFRDEKETVFHANIYRMDRDASFRIEAYFEQQSSLNINLLEFFLTFFGCFLSLLFVASIGWKIRSRYHSYLVTRQRRAERDRMANRPFSTVHLLLPNDLDVISKSSPNPVAMEPLAKNKVAVASVIVLLPAGEDGVTPVGQCGVCFGSMLLAHGNHQHTCIRSRIGHKKPKKRATMTTYHL